ncbi:MAG: GtrA family protein [Candidatus Azambacteria bacterium]|nr:GtrA family protein [Candidatus Azambacteria bacterium]
MFFSKKDFWLAVLAGEIVVWLSLPTLKNLKILGLLVARGIGLTNFVFLWAIFIPLGAITGLGAFYFLAKYKERVGFFQLGKYGVIGVLNTFLNAGIYNLLIFITDTSTGIKVDLFFVAAFIVTVINSFIWNKYWSFEERQTETIASEALRFFSVSAAVAVVNIAILHVIINVIGTPAGLDSKIWANIALVFTIITAFFGNFFGYKFIVFKK